MNEMKVHMPFKVFMAEERMVNRWLISTVFLVGMVAGALLMTMMAIAGVSLGA